MSVKFEQKETIRANVPQAKQDLAHEVGNALTRGGGPQGYLAVCWNTRARNVSSPWLMNRDCRPT